MSTTLVVGDGPLAKSLITLLEETGTPYIAYVWGEHGPEQDPLANLETTLANTETLITTVVEAVLANKNLKQAALEVIDRVLLSSDVLLLTCMLNATATESNSWLANSRNTAGWAALPPLAQRDLVEVAEGIGTEAGALEATMAYFTRLGKKPVEIKDSVGGVTGRVLCALINNAAFALLNGVASKEDIDKAMKLGTNYPLGPLEWADQIGLDQVVGVLDALSEANSPERYRPAVNLRAFVNAGHWGTRTKQGFYATVTEA